MNLPMPAPGRGDLVDGPPVGDSPAPLPPWHDLLAAIVDHLDVPLPDDYDDNLKYRCLLESRAAQLRGYLKGMVEEQHEPTFHVDGIRDMTASLPITYVPYAFCQTDTEKAGL